MEKWTGAAAVCINEKNELLMVKQGSPDEPKRWSVPSGGLENGETLEQCCIREVKEETGYDIQIMQNLFVKKEAILGYKIEAHYFLVEVIGGTRSIQDPDNLIYEVAWKTADDLKKLQLSYPDDRELLLELLERHSVR